MQPVRITDDAFCIAVLGDFLGAGSGSQGTAGVTWEPRRATPDTVIGLTGLRPRIRVSVGEDAAVEEVEFSSLESFEPWDLFRRLQLFGPIREARKAAEMGPSEPGRTVGGTGRAPWPESRNETGGGSLLDAILDETEPPEDGTLPHSREELDAFVKKVVRPHLVEADTERPKRVAAVDQEASRLMSSLLHCENFQRLEALWRSLVVLLSRIEATGKIRVYLVHLPKGELEQDLLGTDDPTRSRLHDLLSDPGLGVQGRRWAAVVGAYGFGLEGDDVHLLERLALVAQAAQVPWLSSVRAEAADDGGPEGKDLMAGFRHPSEAWARFRERPEAAWMGLTYPRFLVREPYGPSSRRSKVFEFRETTASPGDFLWGEGAILCAILLAQGFATHGWSFRPEDHLELGGMALSGKGGDAGPPPASIQAPLSIGMTGELTGLGLIPLMGFPERAGIRIGGFGSAASSGESLAAWWRR